MVKDFFFWLVDDADVDFTCGDLEAVFGDTGWGCEPDNGTTCLV
jgi:hypothetical protein